MASDKLQQLRAKIDRSRSNKKKKMTVPPTNKGGNNGLRRSPRNNPKQTAEISQKKGTPPTKSSTISTISSRKAATRQHASAAKKASSGGKPKPPPPPGPPPPRAVKSGTKPKPPPPPGPPPTRAAATEKAPNPAAAEDRDEAALLLLGLSSGDGKNKKRAAAADGNEKTAATTTGTVKPPEKKKKRNVPPTTAKQMLDNHARRQWGNSMKNSLHRIQKLTYPVTRTDDYEATPKGKEPTEEEVNEQDWPWVIPGTFVYTEQEANANGSGDPRRLRQPIVHFYTGSQEACDILDEALRRGVNGVKVKICSHNDFDAFIESVYRSESGLEAAKKHRNNPNHAAGGAKFGKNKKDPEETESEEDEN